MSVLSPQQTDPDNRPPEQTLSFVNPLARGRVLVVSAVGEADGSRGGAAALACARAEVDAATLLVDAGGSAPRPTLIASAAAQKLEERLAAHLPDHRVAARGQVCHLGVPAEVEGLEAAAAAATILRDGLTVLHVPPPLLQPALACPNLRPSGVLLRANLQEDRALVSLVVRDLLGSGLAVGVLKHRLSWVAERRALFGVLPPGGSGGLPERLVRRLCGPQR
jgi:hypothetical protein